MLRFRTRLTPTSDQDFPASRGSWDVQVSTIWRGEARLKIFDNPYPELAELRRVRVIAGYRFSFALTAGDLHVLRDLRKKDS
jgi:hypothetical protein